MKLKKSSTKKKQVKGADYYDEVYKNYKTPTRYDLIYKTIGELAKGRVIDIGCGQAQLAQYVKNYRGFDFSVEAIKNVEGKRVWRGNIYDKKNYRDYDTYILCEVLEHLKFDKNVLSNIPAGKHVILTVPSFPDPAHLRTYRNFNRYKNLIRIKQIRRFNWHGRWDDTFSRTKDHILLADAVRI